MLQLSLERQPPYFITRWFTKYLSFEIKMTVPTESPKRPSTHAEVHKYILLSALPINESSNFLL
jgi:hypothetical protein